MSRSDSLQAPQELRDRIQLAQNVVIEVGTADQPSPGLLSRSGLYIGWNIDPAAHVILQSEISKSGNTNAISVLADTRRGVGVVSLLGCQTADLVVVCNVLGEPDSTTSYQSDRRLNPDSISYAGHSSDKEKIRTLAVCSQLLAEGGDLMIVEGMTPRYDFGEHGSVADIIGSLGLGVDREVHGYRGFIEEVTQLGGQYDLGSNPDMYVLHASHR